MIAKRRLLSIVALVALLALLPIGAAQAWQVTPEVAAPFRDYYAQHQGIRVLGYPLTDLLEVGAYPAQYFEKGRIEDHQRDLTDPTWTFMFGRLTDELMARDVGGAVTGTNVTYGALADAHRLPARVPTPTGFAGETMTMRTGEFVPYDATLRPAPGYIVPLYFWAYINRTDLFPGGWLHDLGLPMTDAFQATAVKNGERRTISMQAFERTVLTYDPQNPPAWQVERGNIGADALRTLSLPQPTSMIAIPAAGERLTLPLHILARIGQPGGQLIARLRWQDGTELMRVLPILRGEDGQGLLIGTLNWMNEGPPPQPPTQPATLELLSASGQLQARQTVTALSASDPDTQLVTLYWYWARKSCRCSSASRARSRSARRR